MEATAFQLTPPLPQPPPPLNFSTLARISVALTTPSLFKTSSRPTAALCRTKKIQEQEQDLDGLPKEFYDDEWQAQQCEKTKKLHRQRQEEDEEEERKVQEYREIGMRLKDYPEDELRKAKLLVSSLLKSAEEVEESYCKFIAKIKLPPQGVPLECSGYAHLHHEQKIEEAGERGELTELVLMVIWNRLDLARRDEEKDAIRSLDLLYRRIETEILKREAPPAMRLLNDLLMLHDGFNEEVWLKECRKRMAETFPREDPYSVLVPVGFDIDKHQGPLPPVVDDDVLLRVDFVREVDALLQEVRSEQREEQNSQGLDPESVAIRLKQQEKQQTIRLVEALLDLAIDLKW